MIIKSIVTRFEQFKLTRPYAISFRDMTDYAVNGIIAIETNNGLIGHGAASPEHFVTGETIDDCKKILNETALDWLIGKDVRHLPSLIRELEGYAPRQPAARAAVDIALHDLLAQHLELPLVDMLGRAHEALPTSITIGIKSVEDTLAEADEYLGRGFTVLKVKLGESLNSDLERLHKLREHVPKNTTIRVDPNQGYSGQEIIEFFDAAKKLDIEFLEQPTPAKDIETLRNLPADIRRFIAADETLLCEKDALELIAPPKACGIFNIKLMKCGGIAAGARIASIANTAGVELMWGCMDESVISISAALHVALSSPATRYLDLDGSLDLATDVVTGGFELKGGIMRTTNNSGLGVIPV